MLSEVKIKELSLANRKSMDDLFFLNGYLLMFVSFYLTTTMWTSIIPSVIITGLKYLGFLLVVIDVAFYKKFTLRKILVFLIVGALVAISYRASKNQSLIFAMIFIVGATGIDYKKILGMYIKVTIILATLTIIASLIGIIPNIEYVRNGTLRMALGAVYATDFGARVFYFAIACFVYRWEQLRIRDVFFYLLLAIVVWKTSYARMNMALISLLVLASLFIVIFNSHRNNRFLQMISRIIFKINVGLPIVLFIIINCLSYFYSSSKTAFLMLDSVLSGRLHLGYLAYRFYHPTLFGQVVFQRGWGGIDSSNSGSINYFMIDSAFVRLLLIYGVLVTIIVLLCWTILQIRLIRYGLIAYSIALAIIAISGMIDQHVFEIAYNPLIALFAFNLPYNSHLKVRGEL